MTEEIDQEIERLLSELRFYDYDGNPCARRTWIDLFEDREGRTLARDVVAGVTVSTVWLGLDHSFGHGEVPVLWETLVFTPAIRDPEAREEMYRYSSRESALRNHARLVEELRLLERAQ